MRPFLIAVLVVGLGVACGGKEKEAQEYESLPPVPPPAEKMEPATPTPVTPAPAATMTPAPAPAPTRPAMRPSSGGRFVVQVAAWRTREDAEKMAGWLKQNQHQAFVERADLPQLGIYYRVRIGPFATKSEAKAVGELLKGSFVSDYWIDNYRAKS